MAHHGTLEAQRDYAAKNREYYQSYGRAYYQSHKAYFRAANGKARGFKRLLINDLKNTPCLDCKKRYPACVMQFDHRNPAEKLFNVARMENKTKKAIYAEAAKCDVVCANCHAERTQDRRSARRY